MFPTSLLSTLLLALAVAANPVVVRDSPITLPFSRKIDLTGAQTLYEHDLARATYLKSRHLSDHAKRQSTSAENSGVSYIASVDVGSPATTCESSMKRFVTLSDSLMNLKSI